MQILLSNDDGVFAKGIEVMHRYLNRHYWGASLINHGSNLGGAAIYSCSAAVMLEARYQLSMIKPWLEA